MNSTWELRKVCTSNTEALGGLCDPRGSIGFVVFGPDCGEKFNIAVAIRDAIGGAKINPSHLLIRDLFEGHNNIIVIMDGESSCSHKRRHELFVSLKNAKAKILVGVYVNWQDTPKHTLAPREQFVRQLKRLHRNPPTADGIDRLIVVTPEEQE